MSGSKPGQNGLVSILRHAPGITYRMLDYWCRTGVIKIRADGNGSGSRRMGDGAEWEAILDVTIEYEAIERRRARLMSGQYYANRLAHHRQQENQHAPQDRNDSPSPRGVLDGGDRGVPASADPR